MKSHLFFSAALLTAVWCLTSTSYVMESNASYSCCETPTIRFNMSCKSTWSINDKPFAHYKANDPNWIPPCKNIEGGQMTLESCLDVIAAIVCTKKGVVQERRISYVGQRCSASGSNKPGGQGLLLLAIVLLFV
ncbi:hypothetical protein PAMA_015655 [Pampus argenteus]